MSEFKPMIKMNTTEPSVELKLKKGGSAHHKHHHEHHEHHGKKVVKKAMGGLPTAGMAVPAAGVSGRPSMAQRMAMMAGRRAAPMATPMMKKGGKASEAELKKLHAELKHHEHMKAGKAHHGLKKGGTTGQAIPADTHKKHGGRMHKFAKGGKVAGHGEGEVAYTSGFGKLGDELDNFQVRSAINGHAHEYLNTLMHTHTADKSKGPSGDVHMGNAGGYKKGGKVHHKEHHEEHEERHEHHEAHHHLSKAHHHAQKHAEGGSSHHERMMKHHMKKAQECMGHYKKGGSVAEKHGHGIGTIEGNAGEFLNTKHNTAHPDHSKGPTGDVEMGNGGGYKRGGKIHHHAKGGKVHHEAHGKHFSTGAIMGDHPLAGRRAGVSSETVAQPHQWEFGNVEGTRPGVRGTTTGEVRNGNAGGYKHGGKPVKKRFATGGSVNDTGRAVAMKQGNKPASPFVSINELSGTFKKGGKVKKFDGGGSTGTDTPPPDIADAYQTMKNQQGYQNFQKNKENEKSQPDFLDNMLQSVRNYMSGTPTPPAGSVTKTTKSITVTPKKRGGRAK